jgi:hypothetical protein
MPTSSAATGPWPPPAVIGTRMGTNAVRCSITWQSVPTTVDVM